MCGGDKVYRLPEYEVKEAWREARAGLAVVGLVLLFCAVALWVCLWGR